jgi:hypothetical protein
MRTLGFAWATPVTWTAGGSAPSSSPWVTGHLHPRGGARPSEADREAWVERLGSSLRSWVSVIVSREHELLPWSQAHLTALGDPPGRADRSSRCRARRDHDRDQKGRSLGDPKKPRHSAAPRLKRGEEVAADHEAVLDAPGAFEPVDNEEEVSSWEPESPTSSRRGPSRRSLRSKSTGARLRRSEAAPAPEPRPLRRKIGRMSYGANPKGNEECR